MTAARAGACAVAAMLLSTACSTDDGPAVGTNDDSGDGTGDDPGGTGTRTSDDPVGPSDTERGEPGSSSSGSPDDDGTETEDGADETTGGTIAGEPARGVAISRVDANPGVAIPLVVDGQAIAPIARNAQLARGRDTAFRVYLDVDDQVWVERPIEARITLEQTDGRSESYSDTATIAGDSSSVTLQSNILVLVPGDAIEPGAEYRVELLEAGGDYDGLEPVDAPPSATPDAQPLGVAPSQQNMRVVLIPIEYSSPACSTSVVLDDAVLAEYEDALFQHYGLGSIEITPHEPLLVDDIDLSAYDGMVDLLTRTSQIRAADQPDPNVYYSAVFDNCASCQEGACVTGIGAYAGPSMADGATRISVVSASFDGPDALVHEIGHNHGQQHVACPFLAQGDPAYPYPSGTTGGWGFGVRDSMFRGGFDHYDFMSYCDPAWVSDWQWATTFERIALLSSWDGADMADAMDASRILVGVVDTETGTSDWWTDRGFVEPHDVDDFAVVRYVSNTGRVARTEAALQPWADASDRWVLVRAPLSGVDDYARVEVDLPSASLIVERSRIEASADAK